MAKKKQPVRILFDAKDSPTISSGYGIVGQHLLPRFAEKYGADNIIIFAPVFTRNEVRMWKGMKIVSGISDDYGDNMIPSHWDNYKPTFLLTLGDWFPLRGIGELAAANRILWIHSGPYDWLKVPPPHVEATIRHAWKVVPWTKYALEKFKSHDLKNLGPIIPLGVDTKLWVPLDRMQFPQVMGSMGYREDTYNILIIGANQRRKYWSEQLEGIALFRRVHPETPVRLYIHTFRHGEVDMEETVAGFGLQDIVRYTDEYVMSQGGLPETTLVKMTNCCDVVLNCNLEGFGLVMAQAQSVGVPVITLAEGPGPEIVEYGAAIPAFAVDYSQLATKPIPSPIEVARALEEVEKWRGKRSQIARQHMIKNYDWDVVAGQWFTFIEELMEERERYSLYKPSPSAYLKRRTAKVLDLP